MRDRVDNLSNDIDEVKNILNTETPRCYIYDKEVFDFDDPRKKPGMYRLGGAENIQNPPVSGYRTHYGNVLVINAKQADTVTMLMFPYNSNEILFRSGSYSNFSSNAWKSVNAEDIV